MEKEIWPIRFIALQKVPFIYRLIATNLIHVIGHEGWVLDMEFQENLLSERRDTAKKVLSSSHKLTFTMD